MTAIFLFFAVLGSVLLIGQFILTVLGFMQDAELVDDIPEDMDTDALTSEFNDATDAVGDGGDASHHSHGQGHDSTWLFGVISIRTLIAAAAFFGWIGLTAEGAGQGPVASTVWGSIAGVAAMFGVHYLLKQMSRLAEDGTMKIAKAIGQHGTVYIPIAASRGQAGKVQLKVQSRLMEFEAITNSDQRLGTGQKVRVVGVQGTTLEVIPEESVT
ncbi:MAG: NfeD family protein [Planctomycetaceae bacterium]